jgi:hypothetical protein
MKLTIFASCGNNMNRVKRYLAVIFVVLSASISAYATTYYTTGTGDWRTDAIWGTSTSGPGALWSTITLVAGDILVIDDDITLNNAPSLEILVDITIIIDAELSIEKQLKLTSNSSIEFSSNGSVSALGGGASSKIAFGGVSVWDGHDPDISGPGTLDQTSSNGVLPIELIFFNAKAINKKVELTWATASEENFNYFSIERSFDGLHFIEIAQVNGNGSSYQRIDYTLTDKDPAVGISYYRLRSIDFDGYTEIFDYAIVNVEGVKFQANVFPNPVSSGVVTVQMNFNLEEEAQVLFYNNIGLIKLELSVNSWLNRLDISSLAPGSYLVKIITKNGVFVKRLLIK